MSEETIATISLPMEWTFWPPVHLMTLYFQVWPQLITRYIIIRGSFGYNLFFLSLAGLIPGLVSRRAEKQEAEASSETQQGSEGFQQVKVKQKVAEFRVEKTPHSEDDVAKDQMETR